MTNPTTRIQLTDARALASSLRLQRLTGGRWAAFTNYRENLPYSPKYRSSYFEPRVYVFGEVRGCDHPTLTPPLGGPPPGPCDGRGVITQERRARARAQAGMEPLP